MTMFWEVSKYRGNTVRWLTGSCPVLPVCPSRMVSLWSVPLDTTQRRALPCKATAVTTLCRRHLIYAYTNTRPAWNRNYINHWVYLHIKYWVSLVCQLFQELFYLFFICFKMSYKNMKMEQESALAQQDDSASYYLLLFQGLLLLQLCGHRR